MGVGGYPRHSPEAAGCTDPTGPASGTEHVVRGGSWNFGLDHARAAYRGTVVGWVGNVGVRCAKTP